MKNQIALILLLPFFTNCGTLTGITIDTIRNSKDEKRITNTIQQENQPITFQTIHNASMNARYKGLIYKPENSKLAVQTSVNRESNNEIINLPHIGDSLMIYREDQKKTTGLFRGFNKQKTAYHFIVYNQDLDKTDYIRISSINKMTWNDNYYKIYNLNTDQLFMKYDSSDLGNEIALSELKHLNTNKQRMKFTKTGLIVDGILVAFVVVGCLALDCRNAFSFDFGIDE